MKRPRKSKLQKRKDNSSSLYWRKRADAAWSKAVRQRDNHQCCICHKTEYVQAHHLIPRAAMFYRHNIENGITLCPQHHEYSIELSAHGAPWAFEEWMKANMTERYEWFVKNRHELHPGLKLNYRQIAELLELPGEVSK